MSGPRSVPRLAEAMRRGHELAQQHRARHAGPDRAAWWKEWDEFVRTEWEGWTSLELRIIGAYASAALCYVGSAPATGGLWSPQWNNVIEAEARRRGVARQAEVAG